METSPLIKAHEHARAAARATQASDTTVAINEHTLAAGEFAIAASTTSSAEALRTLRLLEAHHKRLADLLKLPAPKAPSPAKSDPDCDPDNVDDENPNNLENEKAGANDAHAPSTSNTRQPTSIGLRIAGQIPSLAQPRYPVRNTAASITHNLNSARGIRTKFSGPPAAPSVSRDPVSGNVEILPRLNTGRSRMQSIMDNDKPSAPDRSARPIPTSPNTDDGYSRFYSAFGNIMNRISSPLAFAGLPLGSEDSGPGDDSKVRVSIPEPVYTSRGEVSGSGPNALNRSSRLSDSSSVSSQQLSDPDLNKIYSKATVRAMQGLPVNESFYVVPPSGHTVSYANILSYADKEKRRMYASQACVTSGANEDGEADFVDAGEGILAPPGSQSQKQNQTEELRLLIEELHHQNEKLRDAVQTLKKRLHVFEASAQSLTESRIMRPKSPTDSGTLRLPSPASAGPYVEDNLRRQVAELEHQLYEQQRKNTTLETENERLEKRTMSLETDNEKMQRKLRKYKEQWDTLKESAKARRTPQIGVDDSSMSSRIV